MNFPQRPERRPERPGTSQPLWIRALLIVVMTLGALWAITVIVGIILLVT